MISTYSISDFPSFQSIEDQFMLERFENLQRPPKFQWPYKRNFYEIMWLTSGTSINLIDYQQVTVEPNMLFFIYPGQLHQMSKMESVSGFSIMFTEQFLLLNMPNKDAINEFCFLDNCYASSFFKLDDKAIEDLSPVLNLMLNEITRLEKSPSIITSLLSVFLNRTQRLIIENGESTQDLNSIVRFKQLKQLIEDNFAQESQISFYADKLNLTAHRANEICKQVTKKALGEVIRDRILLEAKRLLLHSVYPIGQICDDLGFKDFSYFSRQFKRRTGLTPVEFRKQMYDKYQNS